jgi:peroxiredoxin
MPSGNATASADPRLRAILRPTIIPGGTMMTAALLAAVLVAVVSQSAQGPAIVAPAGPPVLVETGPAATWFLMNERDYQTFVEQHGRENASFVAMTRKPAGLSLRAQYGLNLIVAGHNLSWIVDGGVDDGFTLYADWNANGDLTDDPPLRFTKTDGRHSLHVERELHDGAVAYPLAMTLVLDFVSPPDGSQKKLAMKRYDRTTRTGELTMPGSARLAFRLSGSAGEYGAAYNSVAFDLNGDGSFDGETEVFRVSEQFVDIGDASYAFIVDPHGERLTLTPLAARRPPRAALTVGSIAPDFTFTDLDGTSRKLSDYRGRIVLLDFWGAWCAPCVAEAAKLAAAYEKFHDRGLEILGLDTLDTAEKVRAFAEAHHLRWPLTIEPDHGPLQTLYRVHGWPSYVLLDRDGRIVRAPFGSGTDIESAIAALLR